MSREDEHDWFFWTARGLWVCSKCRAIGRGKAAPAKDSPVVLGKDSLFTCAEYRVKKVQEG